MDSTVPVQTKGFGFSFFGHAAEATAADSLVREFAKPSFHQVQPWISRISDTVPYAGGGSPSPLQGMTTEKRLENHVFWAASSPFDELPPLGRCNLLDPLRDLSGSPV